MSESSVSPAAATAGRGEAGLRRAMIAARTAADNRGQDIVVLDMRELTAVFDYFVLATGTSRRQLHAMSEEIDHVLEQGWATGGWASRATRKAAGSCSTTATW